MNAGPTRRRFTESVFVGQKRPAIKHTWSQNIQSLLTQGWCHDPRKRLTAAQCVDKLRNELVNIRHGDDTDLDHVRRRSTYVYEGDEEVAGIFPNRRAASTSDIHSVLACRSASTSDLSPAFTDNEKTDQDQTSPMVKSSNVDIYKRSNAN